VSGGVDQRPDQIQVVDGGARVGVCEQQRCRVRLLGADVDEVEPLPVDDRREVLDRVQPLLGRSPIECGPALDGVREVGRRGAVDPVVARRRLREARPGQTLAEIPDVLLGDPDGEGTDFGVRSGDRGGCRGVCSSYPQSRIHTGTLRSY
jgi:hypothetical protein